MSKCEEWRTDGGSTVSLKFYLMGKTNIFLNLLIFFAILTSLPISCKNKKNAYHHHVIPLAGTVGNYSLLNMSEYITEIRYIPLETNASSLVGEVRKISYENEKILIKDASQNCFLFDTDGKLCSKIGQFGQGPNDYIFIQEVLILDSFLFLFDQHKILIYDTNGYLVENINCRSIADEYNTSSRRVIPLKNDTFVMDVVSAFNHYPKAVLFETHRFNAKIIKEFPNYIELNKSKPGYFGYEIGILYRFNDDVRVYKVINDTIFTIDQNMEMKPAFIFDLGKYRLTLSFLENKEELRVRNNFITPDAIFESSGHLFIEFQFKNHAPEPFEYTSYTGGVVRQVFNTKVHGVFDKTSGELILMRQPIKGKFGFKNDIDNGPVIWPNYISSNNELVSYVNAEEFLEYYDNIDNPAPQMTEIAKNLSWNDNPIVIIAKLKE